MKKIFFLLAMLAGVATNAQVTVVEPVGANYATKTVSFRVRWNAGTRDATHLSKVWVWVDYIAVNSNNTVSGNTWARALVSGTPTATVGTVSYDGSSRQGFWLQGNSGSYSATVTVRLNVTAAKFSWCAYASDFPPNVMLDKGSYTFKGTPGFRTSNPAQTVTGKTVAKASLTVNASTTFTDATGCPGTGILYCPYTGSDLYMDASHLCRTRTGGAQNWEAWIKDTRDNKYYRIVYMPDTKWWLAQNLKYASGGELKSGCSEDSCGRFYLASALYNGKYTANTQYNCPAGWVLPSSDQWSKLASSINTSLTVVFRDLRSLQAPCTPITDNYGWAAKGRCPLLSEPNDGDTWFAVKTNSGDWASIDQGGGNSLTCNNTSYWLHDAGTMYDKRMAVRCIRP
jgi:uncharacterized protein (TIGR02145 family)